MYRIYINEIRLILAENVPNGLINYQLLDAEGFSIHAFCDELSTTIQPADYLILSAHPATLFQGIKTDLVYIEAAGGLVSNANGDYLFIFRREKWDLPKGKIDAGETPELAAIREVEEECGIRVDELGPLKSETYHIYQMSEKLVLKKTYWFYMEVNGCPDLIPQVEEDITQAVWLGTSELEQVRAKTYPLIRDLIVDL